MIKEIEAPWRRAPVLYEDTVESTNLSLKKMSAEGAVSGTVLTAGIQTAGKGRTGKSFLSPEGGLYMSMLLKFPEFDRRLLTLTAVTAVAVSEALDSFFDIKTEIKWPNDILLNEKKLCGILTEARTGAEGISIIVGIGINLNNESFPGEIKNIACSVFSETGKTSDIREFLLNLVKALDGYFAAAPELPEDCLEKYRSRCSTVGKLLSSSDTAIGVAEDYSLILRHPDGTEGIKFFGEILQQ